MAVASLPPSGSSFNENMLPGRSGQKIVMKIRHLQQVDGDSHRACARCRLPANPSADVCAACRD